MNSKQISLIGAALILVGCCLPVVNAPNSVNVIYMFSPSHLLSGFALVFMVLLGIGAVYRDNVNLLLASVTLSGLIFGFTWLHMLGLLEGTKGLTGLSNTSTGLRSGGIAIAAGLVVMLGSSLMISEERAVQPRQRVRRKHKLKRDNIHRKNVRHSRHSSSIFNSGSRRSGSSRRRSPAAK